MNPADGSVTPILEALSARGIPTVVNTSGVVPEDVRHRHPDLIALSKPSCRPSSSANVGRRSDLGVTSIPGVISVQRPKADLSQAQFGIALWIRAFCHLYGIPLDGFVAVTWKGHDAPARPHSSGGEAEEFVDETDFACHSWLGEGAVATTDHPHHFEALNCRTRRFHALEAAGRPDHTLERSMIRLNDVVQVFRCPMHDLFGQQPFVPLG